MRMTGPQQGEDVPLSEIDLYAPRQFQKISQHPAWASLRKHAPVWRTPGPDGMYFWSLTRFQDVVNVLRDARRFSSRHGTILDVLRGDSAGGSTINLMDPPKHGWVRGPSIRTMSTRVLGARSELVREHVRRIAEPLLQGGVHDVAESMMHLPMAAVGEILGIPRSYWEDVPRWTMSGVAPDDPVLSLDSAGETLHNAHHELFAMFGELISYRRRHPSDDLISVLLNLDFGGRRMDDKQVLLNCYSFVMGANTTTPHTASHMILALAEDPVAWSRLAGHPEHSESTVEEALRWSTPTNHLLRHAQEDVQIRGTHIPAGSLVCAWLASANRDEDVFDDPYVFDPLRSPNPHIAFGHGPHYCIGGPAARVAMIMLAEELATHVKEMTPAGEPQHLHSNFINGLTRLPIDFHVGQGTRANAARKVVSP